MIATLSGDADALAFVLACMKNTPDLYVRAVVEPSLDTRLRDDLGIDSIGLVGLFYAVVDAVLEPGADADEELAKDLVTLGDVVALARRFAAGAAT